MPDTTPSAPKQSPGAGKHPPAGTIGSSPAAGPRAGPAWNESFRPILGDRPLRRLDAFVTRPRVRAGVGIVLVNMRGDARSFAPHQRPTLGELVWAGSGSLYEVDMGLQHTEIVLTLPAEEDAFTFSVHAYVEWQVTDPVQVVRDNIRDVRVMLRPLLYRVLADRTRSVPVSRPATAETKARQALAETDLAGRYGIRVDVVLEFRTDESSVGHATARRQAEHELEMEILKQNLRELQESHNKALVSARVEMYRNIIGQGDIDQFALQLAERPEDVASVVQLMREEREQTRMRITDFVLQMLNSGAIERWEIDDQVRTALSWLKESTEKIIASPEPNQIPATPAGGSGPVTTELPGVAELPRAATPGQETGQAPPSPGDTKA